MKINESYLVRRRFLCGMLGGGAAALGTSVGVPLVAFVAFGLLFIDFRELPLEHLEPGDQAGILQQGMWVAFGVAAGFIVHFLWRITGALSKRESELIQQFLARHGRMPGGAVGRPPGPRIAGRSDMRFLKHLVRLLGEFGEFAWHNKAWWLVPLVLVLLIMTALIVSGQAVAPFIYTLF